MVLAAILLTPTKWLNDKKCYNKQKNKMLETKEQKQIFAGSIILIVILGLVSFLNRGSFNYADTNNYRALQQKSRAEQTANDKFLASLGTSAGAQKAAVSQLLPEAEVKAEVEAALNASQNIVVPAIPDSQVKISSASGKAPLLGYMTQGASIFDDLKTVTDASLDDVYNSAGDVNRVDSLIADATLALNQLNKLTVPKEAVDFHKQLIVGLQTELDQLSSAKSLIADPSSNPWPRMFKDYVITNKVLAAGGADFTKLNQKYNLLGDQESSADVARGSFLVPAASAQLATIDIWQKAQQALEEIAATSIARFMLAFLDKLANKIEQTYRVSNFLYYSDALVSGQYLDDYLNKYVGDALDQKMIRNFIPEITCGNSQDYSQVFMAKASQHLGFDPVSLDPNDPQYYQKLSRVGDFLSSPQGWQLTYQDAASQAAASARSAANTELTSPGYKTARDPSGNIITSIQVSIASLRSIFQRYLSEGSDTSQFTTTQQITSQITQAFLNNFVLKGVVLQEQKTCISVPQVQLVTQIP